MRWQKKQPGVDYRAQWHRKFAWLPVQLNNGQMAWLEFVDARREKNSNYHIGGYVWEYREPHFKGLLP
jgi:hypothetical protein